MDLGIRTAIARAAVVMRRGGWGSKGRCLGGGKILDIEKGTLDEGETTERHTCRVGPCNGKPGRFRDGVSFGGWGLNNYARKFH